MLIQIQDLIAHTISIIVERWRPELRVADILADLDCRDGVGKGGEIRGGG